MITSTVDPGVEINKTDKIKGLSEKFIQLSFKKFVGKAKVENLAALFARARKKNLSLLSKQECEVILKESSAPHFDEGALSVYIPYQEATKKKIFGIGFDLKYEQWGEYDCKFPDEAFPMEDMAILVFKA